MGSGKVDKVIDLLKDNYILLVYGDIKDIDLLVYDGENDNKI